MTDQEKLYEINHAVNKLGIDEALKRLVPPKGSDSGALLADTRSGADDKATKSNGSELALPDQGGGARERSSVDVAFEEWLTSGEGRHLTGYDVFPENLRGGVYHRMRLAFAAGAASSTPPSAPLTQSGADGDERCRYCNGPLKTGIIANLRWCSRCRVGWGTGSRKERSVSGNAEVVASAAKDARPD